MIKILLLLTSVLVAMPMAAVDVAPRISDREIIESLAELKAGQKTLDEKIDLRFAAIDQRFEAIDRRLDFTRRIRRSQPFYAVSRYCEQAYHLLEESRPVPEQNISRGGINLFNHLLFSSWCIFAGKNIYAAVDYS